MAIFQRRFKLNTIGRQSIFTHLLVTIATKERSHPITVQRITTLMRKSQQTDFEEEVNEVNQDLEENAAAHNM